MKRDGCVACLAGCLDIVPGRLAPASLAATSLTPLPMMRWHAGPANSLAGFAVVAARSSSAPAARKKALQRWRDTLQHSSGHTILERTGSSYDFNSTPAMT